MIYEVRRCVSLAHFHIDMSVVILRMSCDCGFAHVRCVVACVLANRTLKWVAHLVHTCECELRWQNLLHTKCGFTLNFHKGLTPILDGPCKEKIASWNLEYKLKYKKSYDYYKSLIFNSFLSLKSIDENKKKSHKTKC